MLPPAQTLVAVELILAVGKGFTVMLADVLVAKQPFPSVLLLVYLVLAPVKGFEALQLPPAGVPLNAIAVPMQPLTFEK